MMVKTVSDRNDRYRSEKICKELTAKYELYFAQGKENVKRHRLKEPDKTKYKIFDTLNATIPKCKNWTELKKELQKQDIAISFKYKGNTDEVQGVMFQKNRYTFNGSKIDRQFSYSKIDYQLNQNDKAQDIHLSARNHSQNQSSVLENVGSVLGGLFDIQPSGMDYDPDEAELLKQYKPKKKKKRGYHL
ncbi:hypothetical protein FACS189431_6500 [Alphaproteobacteria bacterium]|nr:hypothetical protein FACS189431_6500 [Alphaproteobacteria bacterium]